MRVRGLLNLVAVVMAATLCVASSASAEGAVELGGRTSISAVGSVLTSFPDDSDVDNSTTVLVAGTVNYTTESARWEVGAGVAVIGQFAEENVAAYVPSLQARVNSNLFGAEENILLYVGAVAGVLIIDSDDFSDVFGNFGPKAGIEYYFSPNVAGQVEDQFLFSTDGGMANSVTIGFKVLF